MKSKSPAAIDFGPFNGEGSHYRGVEISPQYMQFIFLALTDQNKDRLRASLDNVTGDALVGDHTFKIAKKVVTSTGERPFKAMFNLKNENGEIVGSVLVPDTKMESLVPFFDGIQQRYIDGNESFPRYFETDQCCSNRKTILKALGEDAAMANGRGGGVRNIKLGLLHATMRVTATTKPNHPHNAAFAKAFAASLTSHYEPHFELLCKCIRAEASTQGRHISEESAKDEALRCVSRHCARFGPGPLIILRHSLAVMYAFEMAAFVPFIGPVLQDGTWRAFFELATHIMGTRCPSAFKCLTDPEDLLKEGRLFRIVKQANVETGARQEVQRLVADSHVESLNRQQAAWFPGTRYGPALFQAVLIWNSAVANQKARDVRDVGAANEGHVDRRYLLEDNTALYDALAKDGGCDRRPSRLGDVRVPPRRSPCLASTGLGVDYDPHGRVPVCSRGQFNTTPSLCSERGSFR